MGDLISIRCNKCGNVSEADKQKLEVYLKYPEVDGMGSNLDGLLPK